jgi:hypothetical protein
MRSSGKEIKKTETTRGCRGSRIRNQTGVMGFVLLCAALGQAGCESADTKACQDNYLKTHALISGMDSKAIEGVEPVLEAVEQTIALCQKANSQKELAELEKARKTLQSSADHLRQNGSRKELTPEELEKLLKDGDPNCPKGQSYNYRKTGKQVRCTGPQVVAFSRGQAEEYFKNRGFRLKLDGAHLEAAFGPESYQYEFTGSEDSAKTRCLKVSAALGIPWEESVARVTGAHPAQLKKGKEVRAQDGSKWPLTHTDNEKQAVYTLGKCSE